MSDNNEEIKEAEIEVKKNKNFGKLFYPEDSDEFCWDPTYSSKEIHFSQDCRHSFLFETNYLFRTMIGSRPFMNGVHYWEILADSRTEHELKIGVSM